MTKITSFCSQCGNELKVFEFCTSCECMIESDLQIRLVEVGGVKSLKLPEGFEISINDNFRTNI